MAQQVLFIGESEIKKHSLVDNNVDSKILMKAIELVQVNYLKNILGKTLYNTLVNDVYEYKVNDTPIPDLHSLLLSSYVRPYLINQTVVEFITTSSYRLSNKGVVKLTDDASDNLSDRDISGLKSIFSNYVTQYKAELIEFLRVNKLVNYSENIDTNISSGGSGGWYLKTRLN